MALTLQVTSFQHQALGSQATKTFGAEGGTIGRRPNNDWVLPDPEKFISSCHARINCRNGVWFIEDRSTNGTFINSSPQPVGNGAEQQLHEGDRLQIGEYTVTVSLNAAESSSITGPAGFDLSPGIGSETGPNTGQPSAVDPLDFFADHSGPQSSGGTGEWSTPDNASAMDQHFQPPPVQQTPSPQNAPGGGGGFIPDDEDWNVTTYESSHTGPGPTQPPIPPPASPYQPPAPPSQPMAPAPPVPGDSAGVLAALLQHAGMDVASASSSAASPALLQALGGLLGVCVQGMLEVLKARSEIKSQFRVPVTMMRSVENNPLKFSATPAQALETLLQQQQNQAYMGPVDAFVEGFQDIKAHQMAMMAGMRAAFDAMIERFDPAELVERFDKRGKKGTLLSMPGKGRYWDMYADLYEEWTQDADLNFQKLFGDEFARAYEEQMRRLTTRRGGL